MRALLVMLVTAIALFGCRNDAPEPPRAATTCEDGGCAPAPLVCDDYSVATAEGCVRVGVPACVEGFADDGQGGCEPILPKSACPSGKMAIPGEAACRDVMPCGAGKWGDVPLEKNAMFVDASYAGTDGEGTQEKPFKKIQDAIDRAAGNPLIAIAAGKYEETLTAGRPMRIWGRCPSMVEIKGGVESDAFSSPLLIRSSVEVHGVAFTGPSAGLVVAATAGTAVIDSVWIHDTGVSGLLVAKKGVDTSIKIRNTLIENALEYGALFAEVTAEVDRSVIRNTRSRTTDGKEGQGIVINGPTGKSICTLTVTRSVIEGNHTQNVYAERGVLRFEASVIRFGQPRPSDEGGGLGMEIEDSTLEVVDSAIVDNRVVGAVLAGSSALFERTTVARTGFDENKKFGSGLFATLGKATSKPNKDLTVRDGSIHDVSWFAVMSWGAPVVLERTRIAHVKAQVGTKAYGDGVIASAVRVTSTSPKLEAPTTLERVLVLDVARAGVSVWGTRATVFESRFGCTAFDIELSRVYSTRFGSDLEDDHAIEDRGNNTCGCKGSSTSCKAQQSALPPVPAPTVPK